MSFEELLPPLKAAAAKAPVKVGMIKIGRNSAPRLTVIIRREVLDLLGGKSRRYRVALGKAENAHWLRITQADDGVFEAAELGMAKGGGVFRFRLGDHDRLPLCALPMQETNYEYQKVGKCLLIGLPSWAWDAKRKAEVESIAKRGEKP